MESWKDEGLSCLRKLEEAWLDMQNDKQKSIADALFELSEQAIIYLDADSKIDDQFRSFVRTVDVELDKGYGLLQMRFLQHMEPFQLPELVLRTNNAKGISQELNWRMEEVKLQEALHFTCEAALNAETDHGREETRGQLDDILHQFGDLMHRAPTHSKTGKIVAEYAEQAMKKGHHILSELERLFKEDMRERESRRPEWVPDDSSSHCRMCEDRFIMLWRHRHHCRQCGNLICDDCSKGRKRLPELNYFEDERVCDDCVHKHLEFKPIEFPDELYNFIPSPHPHGD